MLGLSKSPPNHHQAWWLTMCKRDAIKGQRCAWRRETVRERGGRCGAWRLGGSCWCLH
ncbi:hypothetical protein ES332_A02G079100v1 [Gossypium tomentosum]|uniref:Uncharacterized protein n=1 Tax=Gossypium tomentosum TaxID=34277 RepID=A0A5D2RFD0_GOSTO|nr:hypothetical protein ES332_A02G079100v1 [Gossypium tomentosum]